MGSLSILLPKPLHLVQNQLDSCHIYIHQSCIFKVSHFYMCISYLGFILVADHCYQENALLWWH